MVGHSREAGHAPSGDDRDGRSLVAALSYGFIVFVVIMNLLIVLVFGNCLILETIHANSSQTPPPNVFQWSKARACGCKQFADYINILTSGKNKL